jgi:hypothetical protein
MFQEGRIPTERMAPNAAFRLPVFSLRVVAELAFTTRRRLHFLWLSGSILNDNVGIKLPVLAGPSQP